MAQALLALQNITVRFGNFVALHVPSLTVDCGRILAIIGPNGAGKSTLLRVMGLLQRPDQGEIRFEGERVSPKNAFSVRRRMATVFQEPLLVNATVYENAALGLKLRGEDAKSAAQRVQPWLERFGIAHLAQRRARSLSGGEAQRTSLVRALALDPELLLLDEPFSPLDPPTRERLLLDLQTVLRDTGITTVLVTHDRNEALMLAHCIAVIMHGQLLQLGAAAQVFARPVDEEVAAFVGIDTKIPGVVETGANGSAHIRFNGGTAEVSGSLRPGEQVLVCVRPEDIALVPMPADGAPLRSNRISGRVTKITPWGPLYRVTVQCHGNSLVALVSRPAILDLQLREGAEIVASFQPSAVHIIRRKLQA